MEKKLNQNIKPTLIIVCLSIVLVATGIIVTCVCLLNNKFVGCISSKCNYDTKENNLSESTDNINPQKLTNPQNTFENLEKVKYIISEYLRNKGTKGNIESAIVIEKFITSHAFYEKEKINIYRVSLDYAWIQSIFLIKDETILTTINGIDPYIADLDKDGSYEIYAEYSVGSGWVSDHINGYNFNTQTHYELGARGIEDCYLELQDNILYVKMKSSSISGTYWEKEKLPIIIVTVEDLDKIEPAPN